MFNLGGVLILNDRQTSSYVVGHIDYLITQIYRSSGKGTGITYTTIYF